MDISLETFKYLLNRLEEHKLPEDPEKISFRAICVGQPLLLKSVMEIHFNFISLDNVDMHSGERDNGKIVFSIC